jgi:hypothetical protein
VKVRPLRVGETVVSVRDVEASNRATVVREEDERGFVLVQFADGMPRPMPVQSMERVSDRKDESRSRPQSKDLAEAKNLGDYLSRVESGISQRSNK